MFLVMFEGRPFEIFIQRVDAIAAVLVNLQGAEVQVCDLVYKIVFLKRYPGQEEFSRGDQQIKVM
jgi:hypothetical protein